MGDALEREGFNVAGFVQSTPSFVSAGGRPIHSWIDLPSTAREGQLALGVFNREMPYDSLVALANGAGFAVVHMPWDIYALVGHRLGWRYWLAAPQFLRQMASRLHDVEARLADEASRATFRRIIRFRSGEDLDYASFRNNEEQYFNELTLGDDRVAKGCFVDCGAFDGDTYLRFLECRPDGERAVLLEPDAENYRQLVKRTARSGKDLMCLPLAVADQTRTLRFAASSGESSTLDPGGEVSVQAVSLDELLAAQRVGFLKLDVEGGENDALAGAKTIIGRDRPVIAMSLYHRPEDLWVLPETLFLLCADYRFYVRQHYFNSFDCVLYAIPERQRV